MMGHGDQSQEELLLMMMMIHVMTMSIVAGRHAMVHQEKRNDHEEECSGSDDRRYIQKKLSVARIFFNTKNLEVDYDYDDGESSL